MRFAMKKLARVVLLVAAALCALPLLAAEATFDRTLNVNGPVDLEVVTGSGSITVRSGAAGTIRVHGTVSTGFCLGFCGGGDPEATMKAIASNPPIEQSGNTVRIGHLGETQRHENISISYELVVPAETKLLSKTGSGRQEISGVAGPAEVSSGSGTLRLADIAGEVRAHTGSGSITVSKLRGSVRARTGSGSIRGESVGNATSVESRAKYEGKNLPLAPGARATSGNSYAASSTTGSAGAEIDFQTGSGSIRVDDVHGVVRAHTGSGTIELQGQPTGDWSMSTGSGSITVRLPAQAAFYLSAHTSSGSIHSDREVAVQGAIGKHDLRGTVNGGGFHLDLRTGSGRIRIE
jgi:putative adhesin